MPKTRFWSVKGPLDALSQASECQERIGKTRSATFNACDGRSVPFCVAWLIFLASRKSPNVWNLMHTLPSEMD